MNFLKSSKGGGVPFSIQKLCCKFWTFKKGFLNLKFKREKITAWFSKIEGGGQWLFGTSENSSVLVAPTILNRNSDEIVSPVRSLRGKAEWALKPLLAEIAVQCPYLIFVPTHNNHWFCKKHCQGQGMQQHVTNGTTHPRVEFRNTKVTCSIKSAIKTGRGQSVSQSVSEWQGLQMIGLGSDKN